MLRFFHPIYPKIYIQILADEFHADTTQDKSIQDFVNQLFTEIDNWQNPNLTLTAQTSGSTGVPKKIDLSRERIIQSIDRTASYLELENGNSALIVLPIEYISGKMMLYRALHLNLEIYAVPPTTKTLQINKTIDFVALSPLQAENNVENLHLFNKIIIGGGKISQSLEQKIHTSIDKKSKTKIWETFGMTETVSHFALREVYPISKPYFECLSGFHISLNAENCMRVHDNQNQEIYDTHDIIIIHSPTQFQFFGRKDFIINSGGVKINPEIIEKEIDDFMEIESYIIGIPDEVLGEKLVAVVESKNKKNLETSLAELTFTKKYFKPKQIFEVEYFPRKKNGKIDRLELKKIILLPLSN